MKFRTHILAGLVAAAVVPASANAASYVDIGARQQRAEMGLPQETASREPGMLAGDRQDREQRTRHAGIGELQQRGEVGIGNRSGDGSSPEFFVEHQRAMNVGVSHIEASQQAARVVAKANRD